MRPTPAPVPGDLRGLALATMRDARFPVLATIDGNQPRARPVSPVQTTGFTVYVASFRSSHKTGEIDQNARVELCYMSEGHDQVRITGIAELVTDRTVIQEIWDTNPLLRSFLGTIDNPEFMLYRITPTQVRFMREWALEYHDVPLA
jgi:general stress protein 26